MLLSRISLLYQMEYRSEQELVLESEGDPDGGWVDTHHFSDSTILEEKVADMALEDKVGDTVPWFCVSANAHCN